MPVKYKYCLFLIALLSINASCSNSKAKNSEEERKALLEKMKTRLDSLKEARKENPQKYLRDQIKIGLKKAELEDYIAQTPGVTFETKFAAPFDKIVFDKVIAYDYEGNEEAFSSVIGPNGNFIPIIEKQAALNKTQIEFLVNKILTAKSTYGGVTASCFNPHLGFVFYNKTERVFVTDICLGCNYLTSDIDIPAAASHQRKLDKDVIVTDYGFSKKGKAQIIRLAKELDLFYGKTE